MIAFVLSGGGSRGAMQVGALQALVEHGLKPDLVVGSSVGSINGFVLAYEPSLTNLTQLARIWHNMSRDSVYPGNYASMIWRLARGDAGLFPNQNFKAFLAHHLPAGVQTFADVAASAQIRFYAIATRLPSGELHIFGEDPAEDVLNALLASTAQPPFLPPHQVDGQTYIDGGVVANLPLRVALAKGAKTIYALHIAEDLTGIASGRGAMSIAHWSIAKLLHDQVAFELEWARSQRGVAVHYVRLTAEVSVAATDFSQSQRLISRGYELVTQFLDGQSPPPAGAQLGQRIRGWTRPLASLPQQAKTAVQRAIAPERKHEIESS